MYYFKEFVKKYNLDKQFSESYLYVTDDRLVIDLPNYRLSVHGWPDNRVIAMNKIMGIIVTKRFGHNGTARCRNYVMSQLEIMGTDTLEGDWDTERVH